MQTHTSRTPKIQAILIAFLVGFGVLAAWMYRFEIVPTTSSRSVYLIDRLAGRVYRVINDEKIQIEDPEIVTAPPAAK